MNKFEQVKLEAQKYFQKSRASHSWTHIQRVYNLAMKIAKKISKKEEVNLEVLKLAIILHDVARNIQDKSKGKICHAQKGAKIAEKILKKYGFKREIIEQVKHCIKSHRFRKGEEAQTIEAKILSDADNLDALGAIGIGRVFLFAGEIGSKLYNDYDLDIHQSKEYSSEDTAYREFVFKLIKIKNRIFTKEAQKIAQERDMYMRKFFKRFKKEIFADL